MEKYVTEQGCKWEFNPPNTSRFGGVWKRQIDPIRRELARRNVYQLGATKLIHELLVTLMAEVVTRVNARPISVIPIDNPQHMFPAMLLLMKLHPTGTPPGKLLQADISARRQ